MVMGWLLLIGLVVGLALAARGQAIDFLEEFALAEDRLAAIAKLVPGSVDACHYTCLDAQNRGDLAAAAAALQRWESVAPEDPRLPRLRLRQQFLAWPTDRDQTCDRLAELTGVRFDHAPPQEQAEKPRPTALPSDILAPDPLVDNALGRESGLEGFEPAALPWLLAHRELPLPRLRLLLDRLDRADLPGLVERVVAELANAKSRGFGALRVHGLLTLDQLRDLGRRLPVLWGSQEFLAAVLRRQLPDRPEGWESDPGEVSAWLAEIWPQIAGLGPHANPLKAHVLYHWLDADRHAGRYDRERLLEYLKLPRVAANVSRDHLRRLGEKTVPARLDADFRRATGLPPVQDDEELLGDYLLHFLAGPERPAPIVVGDDVGANGPPGSGEPTRPCGPPSAVGGGSGRGAAGGAEGLAGTVVRAIGRMLGGGGEAAPVDREERLVAEFGPYLDHDWLQRKLAELQLMLGAPAPERYHARLGAETVNALRESVRLELRPDNPVSFAVGEPVVLHVGLKHVPRLLVRCFALDAEAFYRQSGREIDTGLDLDGLVAHEERWLEFSQPPIVWHRETLVFPQLAGAGAWLIELVGGGVASRALVRKGSLVVVERVGAAGHVFTVLDDRGRQVPEPRLWLGGRRFTANARGQVVVPFSTEPGRRELVVAADGVAIRHPFMHQAEDYRFEVAVAVDPQSLVEGHEAELLVRTRLSLHGHPVDLKLLIAPSLTLTTRDLDGATASRDFAPLPVANDREAVIRFPVPPRLAALTVEVRAKVEVVSRQQEVALSASQSITVNDTVASERIAEVLLRREPSGWVLEMLGRSGEPKAGQGIDLEIKHRLVKNVVIEVAVQTDAAGRAMLGPLTDAEWVLARWRPDGERKFELHPERAQWPPVVHAAVGETVRLPIAGPVEAAGDRFSLLALCRDLPVSDERAALRIGDGVLTVAGLRAGRYRLTDHRLQATVDLRVAAGEAMCPVRSVGAAGGHGDPVVDGVGEPPSASRPTAAAWSGLPLGVRLHRSAFVDATPRPMPLLTRVEPDPAAGRLRLTVGGADPTTRVHLLATRYVQGAPLGARLRLGSLAAPGAGWWPVPRSTYESSRAIGDELRYVLDRRQRPGRPGNLLRRPSLLLNPTDRRDTETTETVAAAGQGWVGAAAPPPPPCCPAPAPAPAPIGGKGGATPGFDFLGAPAVVVANLRPDADGCIDVPLADFAGRTELQVVLVHLGGVTERRIAMPDTPVQHRSRGLRRPLPPAGHVAQQRRVEVIPAGARIEPGEPGIARCELYPTLPAVFRLMRALNPDPQFAEYAFVLDWPTLSAEARAERYSRYAGHELNLFLYHKDPAWFAAVVRPFVAEKREQTFLDRWLLDADLSEYLRPWAFSRLNIVERILLARRRPDWRERVWRQVRDLTDLQPPDPARWRRLFATGIGGRGLDDDRGPLAAPCETEAPAADEVPEPARARRKMARRVLCDAVPTAGGAGRDRCMGRARVGVGLLQRLAVDKPEDDGQVRAPNPPSELFEAVAASEPPDGDALAADLDDREAARALFRDAGRTREWVETHYRGLPLAETNGELIPPSRFWCDYAAAVAAGGPTPAQPFVSAHVAEATHHVHEMMLALAVLDLPFTAPPPQVVEVDGGRALTVEHPAIAFVEDARPAAPATDELPLLCAQGLFAADDRWTWRGSERVEKTVTGEFVIDRVYGCRVTVTNPTPLPREIDLLLQIPAGAVPVAGGRPTNGLRLSLEPSGTARHEVLFYFPQPGRFSLFPAHLAEDGRLVAWAEPVELVVVAVPSRLDRSSWAHVADRGTADEVIEFLERENLGRIDLPRIAWRLRDRDFHARVVATLRQRLTFDETTFGYGLLHRDDASVRDWLEFSPFVEGFAPELRSPLLTLDAFAHGWWEHREFWPFINARCGQLGQRRQIANTAIADQYRRFLDLLCHRPGLSDSDRLAAVGFLVLMDRIDEALTMFAAIRAPDVTGTMVYDGFAAWLAFSRGDPATAVRVATKHRDHPVERWRQFFREVLDQVAQIEGAAPTLLDARDRDQRLATLAAAEPVLDLELADGRLRLHARNVTRCRLKFYFLDVETAFSRRPFARAGETGFEFVRPNRELDLPLPDTARPAAEGASPAAGGGRPEPVAHEWVIPPDLAVRNFVVEACAGGVIRSAAHFPTAMVVQVAESCGQLRATERAGGRPLPAVYVKVYARLAGGRVEFCKDGYTDLRGVFDYASTSTGVAGRAERLAVLVLSDSHGAVVREVAPPTA